MEIKYDLVMVLKMMVSSTGKDLDERMNELRKLISTIESGIETTMVQMEDQENGERNLKAMAAYKEWLEETHDINIDILERYEKIKEAGDNLSQKLDAVL